ncbi:MAG: hypothetical protein IPL65_15420 [Lewinellaceae bacterium]|nr:hypothetical protein [Lewinellaceae bacterium]
MRCIVCVLCLAIRSDDCAIIFANHFTSSIPLAPIDFPFETGKNIEEANDDTNNLSDEDDKPSNSKIYSADRPANWIIEPNSPSIGFKINKITFIEYVRLQVKKGAKPGEII